MCKVNEDATNLLCKANFLDHMKTFYTQYFALTLYRPTTTTTTTRFYNLKKPFYY